MLKAYDALLQTVVSANAAAANGDNEAFRYECICCGEEVFLAAQDSVYKATHFRHRSGNNDKACELYLGQYGMISSPLSRNQKQERVEFYYQNTHKAFYIGLRFSDDEITTYENSGDFIEVRTSRNEKPFFSKEINHANFYGDVLEKYVLETYAASYYISNTHNNIKSEYNLFGSTGPTFFKIQGEGGDFTAKYIKSKSLYTNVKYFIAWPGQNIAQIRLKKMPGVIIDELMQFKTMNNHTVWALVATFASKTTQLDALLSSWGYNLSFSEELVLLWPPAYESEETLYVSSNTVFVYSSFALQAFGNTNAPADSIHKVDNFITRIDIEGKARIRKKNAEISFVKTAFPSESVLPNVQYSTATKFVVPKKGTFFHFSLRGVEKLIAGQTVFLTNVSSVVECHGNYISSVITMPKAEELSLIEKIRNALSYYWVMIPYEKKLEEYQTEEIAEYLHNSKEKGFINKAVQTIIEEGEHE